MRTDKCDFCKEGKAILKAGDMSVHIIEGELHLIYYDKLVNVLTSQDTIKLKECPMCGRELGDKE